MEQDHADFMLFPPLSTKRPVPTALTPPTILEPLAMTLPAPTILTAAWRPLMVLLRMSTTPEPIMATAALPASM